MHASLHKLKQMKLGSKDDRLNPCIVCHETKEKFRSLKLNPDRKSVSKEVLETLVIDLMVPTKGEPGVFLVVTDAYSRYCHGQYVRNYRSSTLTEALEVILMRFGRSPKEIVLDRQPGFLALTFMRFLMDKNIKIKKAPPNRHLEFMGIIERNIQTLRTISRSAMTDASLSVKFWPYAVRYSIYVKNRLPHQFLDGKSPYWKFYNEDPSLESLKVFGCLAFLMKPTQHRGDKFKPVSDPVIFLGYDEDRSYVSTCLYNPATRRFRIAHLQDLVLHERLTYEHFKRTRLPRTDLPVTPVMFDKHNRFLCETSDEESSDSESSVSEGDTTHVGERTRPTRPPT